MRREKFWKEYLSSEPFSSVSPRFIAWLNSLLMSVLLSYMLELEDILLIWPLWPSSGIDWLIPKLCNPSFFNVEVSAIEFTLESWSPLWLRKTRITRLQWVIIIVIFLGGNRMRAGTLLSRIWWRRQKLKEQFRKEKRGVLLGLRDFEEDNWLICQLRVLCRRDRLKSSGRYRLWWITFKKLLIVKVVVGILSGVRIVGHVSDYFF